MFTAKDIEQINKKGISLEQAKKQINNLISGFPFIDLQEPATINNGIHKLSEQKIKDFITIFDKESGLLKLLKFVPASGAASRMFKKLFNFIHTYKKTEYGFLKFLSDKSPESIFHFIEHLSEFPFYNDLKESFYKNKIDYNQLLKKKKYKKILKYLLEPNGLNLSNLPKALIKFHRYNDMIRTPLDEHLVEAASYCKNNENEAYLHFTVSPEHKIIFEKHINKFRGYFSKKYKIKYNIDFSLQKPYTDTIAIDKDNKPFRDNKNEILFRPGGHGSLIENFNDLDADIIFVKNIDNVVPDRLKEITINYKKALAGFLLNMKNKIHHYLSLIDENKLTDRQMDELLGFINNSLGLKVQTKAKEQIFNLLNRPIRVCGMVPNEDEPGGGPFWVKNENGEVSLQIVETSQVDIDNKSQYKILASSTHFNPVDLVCYTKDFKGNKFDLIKFIDQNTGFVAEKSYDGRLLKALEHPGLWNGAMANWITIFVEVPAVTFNPVKTVFDLLRPEHIN